MFCSRDVIAIIQDFLEESGLIEEDKRPRSRQCHVPFDVRQERLHASTALDRFLVHGDSVLALLVWQPY
jgi:hypothetical protein